MEPLRGLKASGLCAHTSMLEPYRIIPETGVPYRINSNWDNDSGPHPPRLKPQQCVPARPQVTAEAMLRYDTSSMARHTRPASLLSACPDNHPSTMASSSNAPGLVCTLTCGAGSASGTAHVPLWQTLLPMHSGTHERQLQSCPDHPGRQ